jgi:hypothetical protein
MPHNFTVFENVVAAEKTIENILKRVSFVQSGNLLESVKLLPRLHSQ